MLPLEKGYKVVCYYEYFDRQYQKCEHISFEATYRNLEVKEKLELIIKNFNKKMEFNENKKTKQQLILDIVEQFLEIKPFTYANEYIGVILLNYLFLQHEIGFCPLSPENIFKNDTLDINKITERLIDLEHGKKTFVTKLLEAVQKIYPIDYAVDPSVWKDDDIDYDGEEIILEGYEASYEVLIEYFAKHANIKEVNDLIKFDQNKKMCAAAVAGYEKSDLINEVNILRLLSLTNDKDLRQLLVLSAKKKMNNFDFNACLKEAENINKFLNKKIHKKLSFEQARKLNTLIETHKLSFDEAVEVNNLLESSGESYEKICEIQVWVKNHNFTFEDAKKINTLFCDSKLHFNEVLHLKYLLDNSVDKNFDTILKNYLSENNISYKNNKLNQTEQKKASKETKINFIEDKNIQNKFKLYKTNHSDEEVIYKKSSLENNQERVNNLFNINN
jgi:hypothetical protein